MSLFLHKENLFFFSACRGVTITNTSVEWPLSLLCLVFFFFPLIDLKVAQLTFIQSQVYLCDIIGSDSHLCFCFVVPGIRPRTLYAPAVACQGDSSLPCCLLH